MFNDTATTEIYTPAGKTVQSLGLTMFVAAIVGILIVKITSWFNIDTNWFVSLAIMGYNVWLLGEVLCLYGGHWSKHTRTWLIITTIMVCLSLLLIILSLFMEVSASYIVLILLIGNIMEYRVAGKMRKESQQGNVQ